MKCPRCNGDGSVPYHIADDMFDEDVCPMCNGTGEVEQTNEEWLKSMSTEQLADVFFEYRYINATPRQKLWMSASEECIKTDIVEWLKQPHHTAKQLRSICEVDATDINVGMIIGEQVGVNHERGDTQT